MSLTISEFLEPFPNPHHHRPPKSPGKPWVFWGDYEVSQNNSFSAVPGTSIVSEKVKSAISNFVDGRWLLCQFWAPHVTSSGRRLLSTADQPFAVHDLSVTSAIFKLYRQKCQFFIDENKPLDSGGPAAAFHIRVPCNIGITWDVSEYFAFCSTWKSSIMLPICLLSQSYCVGVLEFPVDPNDFSLNDFLLDTVAELKKADLDVFHVENLLPRETLNELKPAKDEIKEALKIVCGSHNLILAQVWIAYEDKSLSSFLEDTERMSALKLTGYLHHECLKEEYNDFVKYYSLCDVNHQGSGVGFALKTLQDYESRYISKLCADMLIDAIPEEDTESSALVICLRSTHTGDFDYAFEFIWDQHSENTILLEGLLLTLKRCLPRFKFASGEELGDEIEVIDVVSSTDGETSNFKIFHEKGLSPVLKASENGKKPMVVGCVTPSEVKCKTNEILLSREVIEKQFGKTMKEAAENLHVSLSTLKRKSKDLGIPKWLGPNFVKRSINDSSIIQFNTNEDDNRQIQESSTANLNKTTVTIKAGYADDMIKFHLPISEATFVTIEKEIGMKFKLSLGTYKLKYFDEVGDWISLTSDEEISECIKSSRLSDRIVVRLRVLRVGI